MLSGLTLAVQCQGKKVVTIEGLAGPGETLHPMQAAFVAADGFQRGYCTPGQIMAAVAVLAEGHGGSDAEIREWMSGNLCRCGPATASFLRSRPSATSAAARPETVMREVAYPRAGVSPSVLIDISAIPSPASRPARPASRSAGWPG